MAVLGGLHEQGQTRVYARRGLVDKLSRKTRQGVKKIKKKDAQFASKEEGLEEDDVPFFAPLRMSPSALTAIMTLSSSASNEIRFDTLCVSLSLSGSQREGVDGPGACASSGITGWFDDGEGLQSALRDSLRFAAERNCWGGGETEEDMRAATG